MKKNTEENGAGREFYSLEQLVEKTGTNKRTIAYYIQKGLLPGVGRRGRRTVYPADFLTKLEILKKYNEERDKGYFVEWTLAGVKRAMDDISADTLAKFRAGQISFKNLNFSRSDANESENRRKPDSANKEQNTHAEFLEIFEKLSAIGQREQEHSSVQSQLSGEILPNVLISVKTDNTEEARNAFNKLIDEIHTAIKNKEASKNAS
tara:strand:- start:11 stop:631 length:621 start_codon:yes stop_codon:yes gene_type:complete